MWVHPGQSLRHTPPTILAAKIISICLIISDGIVIIIMYAYTTLKFPNIRVHLGCCNRSGADPERSKIGNMPHGQRYSEKPTQTRRL